MVLRPVNFLQISDRKSHVVKFCKLKEKTTFLCNLSTTNEIKAELVRPKTFNSLVCLAK